MKAEDELKRGRHCKSRLPYQDRVPQVADRPVVANGHGPERRRLSLRVVASLDFRHARQHASMTPPALPASATPTWNDPPGPRPHVVRWAVGVAAALTVAASIATDPMRCTSAAPCEAGWLFSVVAPMLVGSVVLLWRWPLVALFLGVGYGVASALWDPAWLGQVAAVGYTVLCGVLLLRLLSTRRRRAAELRSSAGAVTVPDWVGRAVREMGPLPWPLGYAMGVVAALVTAVVCAGLLVGSVSTYTERLERAVVTTATVVEVDPEDPLDITLETAGGGTRADVYTLEEHALGERVDVRTDPEDPEWVELTAEPWDETFWLSLVLGALVLAVLFGSEALGRRRGLSALTSGIHPAVQVCAAPVPDREDLVGVAHLDDLARRVFAVVDGRLTVLREAADEGGSPHGPMGFDQDDLEDLRWARPTRALLLGDLREDGRCAVLLGSLMILSPTLSERPRGVVDLPDTAAGQALPSDLESGPTTDEELTLLRAEAFDGAEHVASTGVRPQLPISVPAMAWRRAVAVVQVVAGLAAVPVLLWLSGDPTWWEVVLAAFLAGPALLDGATRLRPALQLTEEGLVHPEGLRCWVVPWGAVRQAMVRDDVLVLELDPASAPEDEADPYSDLMSFESPRLASAEVAQSTAQAVEALRGPGPTDTSTTGPGSHHTGASTAYPGAGRPGPIAVPVVVLLGLHLLLSLLALGYVIGR